MVLGVGLLFSFFATSPYVADIPRYQFVRNFDSRAHLSPQGVVDLKINSFYVAGSTKHTLYLGNWTGPFHLLQVNLMTLDTTHTNLSVPGLKIPDDYRLFRLKVDSPYFYLSHGTMPGIFQGTLNDRKAVKFSKGNTPYFVDAVPVSPRLMALTSLNLESKSNELAALTTDSPFFQFKSDLLEKQIDGFFCVDGMLHFDRELNRLIYLYCYRNEYLVMDTSLNLINRFHTIDTFKTAAIKVAEVKSKNYKTLASPPAKINFKSCVSGKFLFVQSTLLAKNEDKVEFQKSPPIDVYDFWVGQYLYSFHLRDYAGERPSSFTVSDNRVSVIYKDKLVVYQLTTPKNSSEIVAASPQF